MTDQEKDRISDTIATYEFELHKALKRAEELMDDVRALREAVTDDGLKRRGWGMDASSRAFHAMAETVLHDIRCNITEHGGGTTLEQERRIQALQAVVQDEDRAEEQAFNRSFGFHA